MEKAKFDSNRIAYCPYCGKAKQPNPENRWCYGSPIRTCPHCSREYFDERYTELAAADSLPAAPPASKGLKIMGIGAAFVAAALLFYFIEVNSTGRYHVVLPVIGIGGAAIVLLGLIDFVEIKTGKRQKQLDKFYSESKQRLENKDYADKLRQLGILPPERPENL